ncbi:hypothetical protein SAMN04487914_11130 [Arthrobacter sp. ok909]|nr:hypothetical protein SAMN04487914_11130 [Arthrobacter sp. ok909]
MARNPGTLPLNGNTYPFSPTFTVVSVGSTAVRAIVSGADKVALRKRVRALSRKHSAPTTYPASSEWSRRTIHFWWNSIHPLLKLPRLNGWSD